MKNKILLSRRETNVGRRVGKYSPDVGGNTLLFTHPVVQKTLKRKAFKKLFQFIQFSNFNTKYVPRCLNLFIAMLRKLDKNQKDSFKFLKALFPADSKKLR